MIKRDKVLWQILALTGLNFINHRFRLHEKCFRIFFLITFPVSLIYYALLNLWIIRIKHYKDGIAHLLQPVLSALIWYFAYSRKKVISDVLLQIYRYRKRYKNINEKQPYIMPLTITILSSPYLMCIICQIIVDIEMETLKFWTFAFEVHSIIWKRVILLNGQILYSIFCIGFPFYLSFCLSVLFYRCAEMLSNYNIVLQIHLLTETNKNIEIFKIFFDIVKLLNKLNHAVTNLSLLIIVYGIEGIFHVLLNLNFHDELLFNIEYITSLLYYSMSSSVMFLSYTLCCSMIPENLMRIKNSAREFLNKYGYDQSITRESMFYLKRIESEKVVYISAGGLFRLTRSVILSGLGAVLSYGLLIIGLNMGGTV